MRYELNQSMREAITGHGHRHGPEPAPQPGGLQRFACAVLSLSLFACSAPPEKREAPHHAADGFTNPQIAEPTGWSDFLKWQWNRLFKEVPGPEAYDFPVVRPATGNFKDSRSVEAVTWIGHATLLVRMGGANILTDPHFTRRASPVQWVGPERVVPPAMTLEALPPVDYVVISHDHYDSLDAPTIEALFERPDGERITFLVPLGMKAWFEALGITRVVELDWWESYEDGRITFTAVPAQHWSKRSLFSRNETLWAGWVAEAPDFRFYFSGDTGYYAPLFEEIGARLGPFDLAAIPIGGYEPRWFMKTKHVNPEEAVRIHQDVRAAQSVAVHWGTFILTDEPLDEPPARLREALAARGLPEDAFRVLRHGETLTFE